MAADHSIPDPRRWWTLVVLCVSLSVISIDNTVLNVALPTLVNDLDASTAGLQWIVDSYVLVFAGFLLTAGSLGDRFGRKYMLNLGLVIFGVSSTVAAFAPNVAALITARSVMGIGGALMMPSTLSILTNVFTNPVERGRAIGIWAGIAGAAVGLGPIVGGALLRHFWWGSVFLVNGPIVVAALIAGRFLVPNSKDSTAHRLDLVGAVTSILGVSLLVYAIIEVPVKGWGDSTIALSLIGSVLLVGAFIAWERRNPEPMLDIRFFRNPRFTVASLAITLAAFTITGTLFVLTQHLQFVLGYSAFDAGLHMVPVALTMIVLSSVAARLNERFGTKRVVAGGLASSAIGLSILATCTETTGYGRLALGLVVTWAGLVSTLVPATDSIMGSLPRNKSGVGSAVNDTTRQLGSALGVAVLGSLLASAYREELTSSARGLSVSSEMLESARASVGEAIASGNDALASAGRAAYVHGMHTSLVVNAILLVVGGALAFAFLPARARAKAPTDVAGEPDDGDIVLAVTPE